MARRLRVIASRVFNRVQSDKWLSGQGPEKWASSAPPPLSLDQGTYWTISPAISVGRYQVRLCIIAGIWVDRDKEPYEVHVLVFGMSQYPGGMYHRKLKTPQWWRKESWEDRIVRNLVHTSGRGVFVEGREKLLKSLSSNPPVTDRDKD